MVRAFRGSFHGQPISAVAARRLHGSGRPGSGTLVRIRASDASDSGPIRVHTCRLRVPKMPGGVPRVRGPPWLGLRTGRRVEAGRGFGRVHRGDRGTEPYRGRAGAHGSTPGRRPMDSPATKAQRSARCYQCVVINTPPLGRYSKKTVGRGALRTAAEVHSRSRHLATHVPSAVQLSCAPLPFIKISFVQEKRTRLRRVRK